MTPTISADTCEKGSHLSVASSQLLTPTNDSHLKERLSQLVLGLMCVLFHTQSATSTSVNGSTKGSSRPTSTFLQQLLTFYMATNGSTLSTPILTHSKRPSVTSSVFLPKVLAFLFRGELVSYWVLVLRQLQIMHVAFAPRPCWCQRQKDSFIWYQVRQAHFMSCKSVTSANSCFHFKELSHVNDCSSSKKPISTRYQRAAHLLVVQAGPEQ